MKIDSLMKHVMARPVIAVKEQSDALEVVVVGRGRSARRAVMASSMRRRLYRRRWRSAHLYTATEWLDTATTPCSLGRRREQERTHHSFE